MLLARSNSLASWKLALPCLFFRFLTSRHDITAGEENSAQDLAPIFFAAEEKFQVHPEVFELLLLAS